MYKSLIAALLISISGIAYANCGNDNGNGNGCSGNQGPAGANGTNGVDGTNGAAGSNGTSGTTGAVGPAAPVKSAFIAGLALRLFDTRYVSLFAFDDYQLDAAKRHDLIGGGARNNSYGARLVFKLGRDYTETKIDALEKRIRQLEAQ